MGNLKKNYHSIDNHDTESDTHKIAAISNSKSSGSTPNNRRSLFQNLNPESDNHIHPMPELNPQEEHIYRQLQWIHHIMDDAFAIPCTGGRYRTGLDPIVGLIPVLGDCASAVVSLALVARASPVLSKYTTTRMLINVGIDSTVGMVPVLGDAFDFAFQANTRNLAIFEEHMKSGITQRSAVDKTYIVHLVAMFVCWFVSFAAILILLVVSLVMWLRGKFSAS